MSQGAPKAGATASKAGATASKGLGAAGKVGIAGAAKSLAAGKAMFVGGGLVASFAGRRALWPALALGGAVSALVLQPGPFISL